MRRLEGHDEKLKLSAFSVRNALLRTMINYRRYAVFLRVGPPHMRAILQGTSTFPMKDDTS